MIQRVALAFAATFLIANASPPDQAPLALQARVEQALAKAPPGTRFGVLVTGADGRELVAINPDQRFVSASNTKIFTTIAAYALLPDIAAPDAAGGATVALEATGGVPDVVLAGHGDARLSSAADCQQDCLATLADAVAAKARVVGNVIGDDRWYPDQRFSSGMSWDNLVTDSGAGISALSLDDNLLVLSVKGASAGAAPAVKLSPYQTLANDAVSVAQGSSSLVYQRQPGTSTVRLFGRIVTGQAWFDAVGVEDPAHWAAWTLKAMLEARGVRVQGRVVARHRLETLADDPRQRGTDPVVALAEPVPLARLVPPPLAADVVLTNKTSQNLHAELLLRRIGKLAGSGSVQDGLLALHGVMERAGVPRTGYDLSDGSGMSTYNRASPRAVVTLLRWALAQPWGMAWRASLPVGGVDGTLKKRFAGTLAQGRVQAKTGTLNGTNALSGYLVAASGEELAFSIFANDVPEGGSAARVIDAAVVALASAG